MGREEGWLAEHMLILSVTNPKGKKRYFAAAFPSACGKTNLAMLTPKLPGWKVQCVGDDIAWMRFGADGRLYAINPEAGFFGVAPGTSTTSNPNAMAAIAKNTIFTNVALTPDNDVWWEGMTKELPKRVKNWRGADCSPEGGEEAAHPNARFTVAASQCPVIDPDWENPAGVPIDGIIFGGRRSTTVPLVYEALNWEHGVFIGSVVNSETTAAAFGARGVLRPDPFAMKPFCGYNMGDYFQHWLNTGASAPFPQKAPRIFHVNWFKKSPSGRFMWPGFGDNARVLKWMFERLDGTARAVQTPVGLMPDPTTGIDIAGLPDVRHETMQELLRVDPAEWQTEVAAYRDFHAQLGARLPARMTTQLDALKYRLSVAERNTRTESLSLFQYTS
jgi:phosphoenolpyruvate carboxykinase (GTP)